MDIPLFLELLTLLLGFYMAWNIGANDVANAMGTSVGSRALTLVQAICIAAVLEFTGSILLGANVSETIQKGIISPEIFQNEPLIFVLGMLSALLATGILLQLASYFALPISTTHAIVGAVLGFGAFVGGIDAVQWREVGWIVSSWALSPLLSGLFSYLLFHIIQKNILLTRSPIDAAKKIAPFFVCLCFMVATLSFLHQGLAQINFHFSFHESLSIAGSIGLSAAILSFGFLQNISTPALAPIPKELPLDPSKAPHVGVEKIFIPLQIVSACMVALAHGANDVANAIGPVAAVLSVLKTQTIGAHSHIPTWLLALGGLGIVIGLASWGWRVIETIGEKITELTPSRGFAAEFGAATTILLASKLGLPISTTHALVGAVLGVGIARGMGAVNFSMMKEIAISWILTIPLCAFLSIAIFHVLQFIFF